MHVDRLAGGRDGRWTVVQMDRTGGHERRWTGVQASLL
jgi:hypothetical protein